MMIWQAFGGGVVGVGVGVGGGGDVGVGGVGGVHQIFSFGVFFGTMPWRCLCFGDCLHVT